MNRSNGRPSGEAFVQLEDEKDTFGALLLHRQKLGKRFIEVHLSSEEAMEDRVRQVGLRDVSAGWIRCRGLPFQVSGAEVAELFQDFGVAQADVIMSKHSQGSLIGYGNGEAFVKLQDQETALRAQKALHMSWMHARYIEVYLMSEEERFVESFHLEYRNPLLEQASECMLRMRGLPFSSTMEDVLEFFRAAGYGVEAHHVMFLQHPNGRPRGEALVWMPDPAYAQRVREALHKAKLGPRYVELITPGRGLVSWALETHGIPRGVPALEAFCPMNGICPVTRDGWPSGGEGAERGDAVPYMWCHGGGCHGQIFMIGAFNGSSMWSLPPCASSAASSYDGDGDD